MLLHSQKNFHFASSLLLKERKNKNEISAHRTGLTYTISITNKICISKFGRATVAIQNSKQCKFSQVFTCFIE